jgi:hypothetical protein
MSPNRPTKIYPQILSTHTHKTHVKSNPLLRMSKSNSIQAHTLFLANLSTQNNIFLNYCPLLNCKYHKIARICKTHHRTLKTSTVCIITRFTKNPQKCMTCQIPSQGGISNFLRINLLSTLVISSCQNWRKKKHRIKRRKS